MFSNIYKQAPSNNHSANNSATNSPVQTLNNGSNSNSSSMFSSNNVNNSTANNSTNNNSNSSSRTTTPTSQQQQQKQQQQLIAKPKRHGLSLGMSLAMGNTMSATLDKMREAMPNTPSYALDKMREAMPQVNSLQSASQVRGLKWLLHKQHCITYTIIHSAIASLHACCKLSTVCTHQAVIGTRCVICVSTQRAIECAICYLQ
jgi:hypothetical protein